MDPVTQGALGAAVAQLALPLEAKKKHRIWLAGAVGGMAADLDIIIRSAHDPLLSILYHRHFTHALAFIPIGGLIVTLGLLCFPYFRSLPKRTFWAALLGYATHGLLDAATSYGTLLYWPFSMTRVHWDIIFIIEPFFTFPLVIGTCYCVVFQRKRALVIGLSAACAFMSLSALQHFRSLSLLQHYIDTHAITTGSYRSIPSALNTIQWRGLVLEKNVVRIVDMKVPWFHRAEVTKVRRFKRFQADALPPNIQASETLQRDYAIFHWFTGGYLVETHSNPLTLADGRYIIGEKPPRSLWGVVFDPQKKHVQKVRFLAVRNEI